MFVKSMNRRVFNLDCLYICIFVDQFMIRHRHRWGERIVTTVWKNLRISVSSNKIGIFVEDNRDSLRKIDIERKKNRYVLSFIPLILH